MDSIEQSIKVLPFSGKEEEWRIWSVQCMARASRKNWKAVLTGKVMPPKHDATLDETMGDGKKQAAARLANNMAYEDLLLSIDTKAQYFGPCADFNQ